MIVKTRLTQESTFYRLTDIDLSASFDETLKEIQQQWGLPTDAPHSLLWKEDQKDKNILLISTNKEWKLFCRLHSFSQDQIVELQLAGSKTLPELL
jgi:hypothetical protein